MAPPRIHHWSQDLRQRFGGRVARVPLDAGLTCPNRDGTVAAGGCVFCDDTGSRAGHARPDLPIRDQLGQGIAHMRRRFKARRFIAYLQPHTNTHAPLERLREILSEAIDHPGVVGLALGTRADCLPDPVLDLLAEVNRERPVWLEIGLQSASDETLRWMNRGETVAQWEDACRRAKSRGLLVATHLILGLPTDTRGDWLRAGDLIAQHRLDGVKFHMLCITRRARLGELWERSPFPLLTREQYVGTVCDLLERIPPETAVMRLVSECAPADLLAPAWLLDKRATLEAIGHEMERRNSWQGKLCDRVIGSGLSSQAPLQ